MQKIDFSHLIGGNPLCVACNLSFNGLSVTDLKALPDTGADGLAFINRTCTVAIGSFLGVKARKLPCPIYPQGYEGQQGTPITHFIGFDLTIDSCKLVKIPFLILELGRTNIILGLKWLAYFNIQVDAANHKLQWPESIPPDYNQSFARQIYCSYKQLNHWPPEREH